MEKIIKKNPSFKKSTFLFAAISAKNINKLEKSYSLCSIGMKEFPKYVDLIFYRGKIAELR